MNGSMTMTLPVSVVILVVAWPSQWTSILFVCAQAGSATRLHVRAPAPSLRKSRRSISMVVSSSQPDLGAFTVCQLAAMLSDVLPRIKRIRLGSIGTAQRERFTGVPRNEYTAPHL